MQTRACGVVTHTTTDEPNPDPHLRQATLGNVTTLIDSRLRDEDPRAKAVGVAVSYTHLTLPTICSV